MQLVSRTVSNLRACLVLLSITRFWTRPKLTPKPDSERAYLQRVESSTTMADTNIPEGPPPGLFFAGSDDEDEQEGAAMALDDGPQPSDENLNSSPSSPQTPRTSSSRSSLPREQLFLASSDDENDAYAPTASPSKNRPPMDENNSDIEILDESDISRMAGASKSSSSSRATPLSPTPKKEPAQRALPKKRRLSVEEQAPLPQAITRFQPTYLGEVVVPNAWSNVSGKGYVKLNESILVQREQEDDHRLSTSKSKASNGASVKKKADGKKQLTLATMLKSQPQKSTKKKKTDTIVRLVNKKGFGTCP